MPKILSVLVGFFYPIITIAAVLLLAVVQLRSSAGSDFDIWRLSYRSSQTLRGVLKAENKSLNSDLGGIIDDINFAVYCVKQLTNEEFRKTIVNGEVGKRVREKLATNVKLKDLNLRGDELCVARGVPAWEIEKTADDAKRKSLEDQLIANQNRITSNEERFADLSRTNKDFLAFIAMEEDGEWYLHFVPKVQYDLLVLLLVMFMGALGGMVRLLRDYGDAERRNPQPRDYFFVPLIGLVVAIGGFVLAKTGLLLLSSTRQETSLSPFMIGLVGIISGLLAREVIDAIARAGANMMRQRSYGRTRRTKPASRSR